MSRIGKQPVKIPAGVDVNLSGNSLSAKGPKGTLLIIVPDEFDVSIEEGLVKIAPKNDDKKLKALHGLYRSLIANMVEGVSTGYTRELEIQGVGFKASIQGGKAIFLLGFSSPAELIIPDGVEMKINSNVNIVLSGPDKQLIGNFAARVKSLFPAEPYKGKGIRFKGERIRRKVGKTVA